MIFPSDQVKTQASCGRHRAVPVVTGRWRIKSSIRKTEDFYKCNRTSIFVAKIYNCVILNISVPSVYKLHFITYLVLQSDHHHHRAGGRGRAWAGYRATGRGRGNPRLQSGTARAGGRGAPGEEKTRVRSTT